MKALGNKIVQITTGKDVIVEECIMDTCIDHKLTFKHIQTTLELNLKCAPIGMTVVRPSDKRDFYHAIEEMLSEIGRWNFQKSFVENGICAVYLHYYTYVDVFEPQEKRWKLVQVDTPFLQGK